jgi:hypothetical protein
MVLQYKTVKSIGKATLLSAGVGLLCVFLVWLILGDSSPFNEYFLYHVTVPNFVRWLHVLTYLLVVILRPQPPLEAIVVYGSIFIQWFVVAFLFGMAVCGLLKLRQRIK